MACHLEQANQKVGHLRTIQEQMQEEFESSCEGMRQEHADRLKRVEHEGEKLFLEIAKIQEERIAFVNDACKELDTMKKEVTAQTEAVKGWEAERKRREEKSKFWRKFCQICVGAV